MRHVVTVEIGASPQRVWAVLADVRRWPDWTPTMDQVRLRGNEPFGLGSLAEIRQPKLPRNVWLVTAFEPGGRFEWTTAAPGVTTRADHRIEPRSAGRCQVVLEIETTGPLARLVWLLLGRLTRRYVELEASSLKRRCEATRSTDIRR